MPVGRVFAAERLDIRLAIRQLELSCPRASTSATAVAAEQRVNVCVCERKCEKKLYSLADRGIAFQLHDTRAVRITSGTTQHH